MNFLYDLASKPEQYDFAQAMRLLTRLMAKSPRKIQLQLKAEAIPTGDPHEIQYFSFKGNKAKLRLAKQALSGVKGVLPNYIYEEMLTALYREDHALKDFLDVFNQRHFEITYRLDAQSWLLVEKEQSPQKVELLQHLAALHQQQQGHFQYTLLLGQQSRNLSVLAQLLNDHFPYHIEVKCKLSERRKLPSDSLTKLGCHESYNSRIGQGFLLGSTCTAHFNHIQIFVTPKSLREFSALQADKQLGNVMKQLAQHYLRDNTQISIYMTVKRAYLERPVLSTQTIIAAKLGEVDCLAPERNPNKTMKILLI